MPTAALFILQEYFCDHSKDKYTDMLRESLKTLANLKKFFVFSKKRGILGKMIYAFFLWHKSFMR